jgi:Domain of unknown function (DUF222)/HNH endonuclease
MEAGVWGVAPGAGEAIAAELIRRRRKIDQEELEFSCLAAQFAQTDECDQQGFDSPISWIKANCHMSGGAAADRVCAGQQLGRLAQSSAALAAGEIGFAHFALIARTSAALGDRLDEAKLLRQARKLNIFPFRNTCTHARHAGDPGGFVNEEKEGVHARSLTLTTADDGVVLVQGLLDKVGGAALRTALEPLAKRAGKYDDRDRERRLADALVDLSMHALDNGVPSHRTHLQVTTSLETLLGLSGAPAAEMEFSLPISSKAVERLACDCSITRILLGSDSTVIDVGRAKRVVSGPQSKALKVRDRGCTWPGCDRPATWTSAHHIVHWIHGGSTDLPNLVLLCYRHHWMVHEGNWQIVRSDDGYVHTIPPLIGFGPPSRGPDETSLSNVRSP